MSLTDLMQLDNIKRTKLEYNVDRLGKINAQIADLQVEADTLIAKIKLRGVGAYEGRLFRATVSKSSRDVLDMEAVRGKLSAQFIAAHTRQTAVITCRVVSR